MSLKAATSSSLSVPVNDLPPDSVVFGESFAMQVVREKIERLAGADIPVLVQGETGTGKEELVGVEVRSPGGLARLESIGNLFPLSEMFFSCSARQP